MIINFILPGRGLQYAGGFHVMYNYAIEMASRGHNVKLIHTPYRDFYGSKPSHLKANLSFMIGAVNSDFWLIDKLKTPYERLQLSWVPEVTNKHIPDADVTVISYWRSADFVKRLAPRKGRLVYLFQEFEKYMSEGDEIRRRFCEALDGNFQFLAISPAAMDLLKSFGDKQVSYQPNGVDLDTYRATVPLDSPLRDSIGFPFRLEPLKRSDLAIRVLEDLRKEFDPSIKVWSFGPPHRGKVPGWMTYHEHPSNDELRALYNQTMLFVTPSDYEGWGLPGCEAMSCGAALVSTDTGGVHAYAVHESTALISPRGDAVSLRANIQRLLQDRQQLLGIARQGQKSIQQLTLRRSYDQFERELVENN